MNITTKLLFTFSLFISLPTFCMDLMDLAEDAPAETVDLDDGKKWVNPRDGQQVAPFAGKLVACRSDGLRAGYGLGALYKIDQNNPTGYALISARIDGSNGYFYHRLYTCPRTKLLHVRNGSVAISLTTRELERTPWFLRLPTYNEICHLSKALKNDEMRYNTFGDFDAAAQILKPFTLDNVLQEDRGSYFRSQARKHMWPWQRLLHIGRRDPGSQLHRLPKDMIGLLTQYVFNAQAQALMENAEPNQILE
jgi:hypothetical protein